MSAFIKFVVWTGSCIWVAAMISQASALENPPTQVETAPNALPTCAAPITPTHAEGGYLTRSPNESFQRKRWQPRGGEIALTIKVPKGFQSDSVVRVCFRWHQTKGKPQGFKEASARIDSLTADRSPTIIATVPEMESSPSRAEWTARFFGADDPQEIGAYTGLWLVPIADVRIMIIDKNGTINADVIGAMGITSSWWALALAILSVAVVFIMLSHFCSNRLPLLAHVSPVLRVITTSRGYASLSQFQIILWTFVVGTSVIYVMALSGELIKISAGTLVLLGIAGTATLSSQMQSNKEDAKAAGAAPQVAAAGAPPPAQPAQPAPAAQPLAPHSTSWCDLVITDGQIDVTRLQMLYFTVVVAAFVIMTVLTSYVIPEIPESFLILMGISNGVYVAAKFNK